MGWVWVSAAAQAAETAKILPKGVSRARVVAVQSSDIIEKYNSDGILEPFTRSLNRTLTTRDYVEREPRLGQLVHALNGVEAGLGDQLLNTELYGRFSLTAREFDLAFERGLTEKVSFGMRIPMIRRTVVARLDAFTTNNAEAIGREIGKLDPELSAGIYDVASQRFDRGFFEQAVFASKGYEVPRDFEKTQLGDIEGGVKRMLYDTKPWLISGLVGGRLPTGARKSLTNLFDSGTGDGCWAFGGQLFQEYQANSYLTFGAMQKAGWFFADTRPRAVPKGPDDALPSLLPEDGQVREVRRQQSPQFEGEISASLGGPTSAWSAWTAIQHAFQAPAKYTGDGDLYYAGLSKGTGFYRTSLELGAGYSTIPAFLAKRFPVPMGLDVIYNSVLRGMNEPLTRYVRLDFKVFF